MGDSGRGGLCCRICDRKYILYVRYQQYAREIGIKDQLIQEKTEKLAEMTSEVKSRLDALGKIQ